MGVGAFKTLMENKKTTELIDLLTKLTDEDGHVREGYEDALAELEQREPFFQILNKDWDSSIPAIMKEIDELREDIKKLKRHKHDEKTGDVLIRI